MISALEISNLKAGDTYKYSGELYTARDQAHKLLVEAICSGRRLPIDINGAVVYYAGPCPAKAGRPIGPVGPTTSGRMDSYSPILIGHGLKIMIGKGPRSEEVTRAIKKYKGIYFAAVGGAGALLSKCVTSSSIAAFENLGPEAVYRLTVKDLPLIVAVDSEGRDLYEIGPKFYATK
ncbi:MAG: FumA C-terminus/TtdB family hydratase beta subunit [Clostridiales bacterium]|jgi:fumarate hydratase subunit beta|nr:FumA C-terminus/TtdB family hydratase beta subunit [Clostridiales bacterium]